MTNPETAITDALRAYVHDGCRGTHHLATAAPHIVALRATYTRNDAPDYGGWSHDYRKHMGLIYDAAAVPDDKRIRARMYAALHYHVANELRRIVPDEHREAAGLVSHSPQERLRDQRRRTSDAVRQVQRSARDVVRAFGRDAPVLTREQQRCLDELLRVCAGLSPYVSPSLKETTR